jgi:ATP-dependent helicase/nuclease subunit B
LLELAPQLDAALGADRTVVVPTAQRAAAVRLGFALRRLKAGQRAFHTPDVRSFNGWLRAQPGPAGPGRVARRLGAAEEWLLWREAVTDAAARLSVPGVTGLVDAIRRSAALLFEWRIPPAALVESGTLEAALLHDSLAAMEARLVELSAAGSWRVLHDLAAEPPARAPVFAGFTQITPARRALLAGLRSNSREALELTCEFAPAPSAMVEAPDPAGELACIAHWCRERLAAAPAARLLVVVPELAQRREEVRRVFESVLDPEYLDRDGNEPEAMRFALEGGQPLLDYGPVGAALRTLQLLSAEVELSEISQWVRGGFWARPAASERAKLDVWLRTVVPPRLDGRQLLRVLRAAPASLLTQADLLANIVDGALELLQGGSRASLGEWSGRFARILGLCDLTASAARQRTSHTQQVLQRLDEVLRECVALSANLGMFRAAEAVSVFGQLLARTRFEPATGDAAVTLTASLADPVLRYDGIWVSGLHAGVIPERVQFDPFIPAALQREAGIGAVDAAARVAEARRALQILCCSSREFIVSAPSQIGDQRCVPSPLLAPYAARSHAPTAFHGAGPAQVIRAARQVESYEDESGATWPGELPLPGGTRAIELQSRCPFRAYAQLRLGAEPLAAPVPGITPRERGVLLHRALERLWQRLGGSEGLAGARAAGTLAACIGECVAQAAGQMLQRQTAEADEDEGLSAAADASGLQQLRQAAIARECARAQRLIQALCDLEAGRPAFRIEQLETLHDLSVGGARLNVRIDRVDRLADDTCAILDYKSGRAMRPDWDEARTTHPQLLVYQLAAGVPVSALAVAHLTPKSVAFKGIADQDGRLPEVKGLLAPAGAWARQQALWREQVARLARGFVAGEARVDPVEGACRYCHLHALCRIGDVAQTGADADADADADAEEEEAS